MLGKTKALIIGAVAALLTPFAATPVHAQTFTLDFSDRSSYTAFAANAQALNLGNSDLATESLDALSLATTADAVAATHTFDVAAAIAAAKSEVGTSRPTGWSQPGECVISANRWLRAGGSNWVSSGSPVTTYSQAKRLPLSAALPGDVIQFENLAYPDSWATGVHTMLVVGVNDDGTYHIIHSNFSGAGLVTEELNFKITPPAGFQAVAWRF
ncbi:lipase [Leucobacter sp. OH2974_COT-288]|uniref:Lipase n=1 Tax=Canibacter oris TaxID=1365628 RepID=A0A840DDD9_9MICO|nr:lipase [Canibacter oris]MBB4071064.1 hypothetical protein [Canibacter oris]RRD35467.1 lipase [Leucobacter sp. OH2974_COT-288]